MNQPVPEFQPQSAGTAVKTTTCYMCACRCGIRVTVKDGEVRYIEGNPALMSKGRMAAGISITLWTCIMIAGRGIGYLTAPAGLHFAGLLGRLTNVL
mgnify:CR=1 FL=1